MHLISHSSLADRAALRILSRSLTARTSQSDVDAGLFQPSESDVLAELELAAGARWVAEYYPCDSVTELGEGRLRIAIRTPDTSLIRRLALRLGEEARVTAPAALAEEVRSAAAAALSLYD
jgi:proteasome accessory factor C